MGQWLLLLGGLIAWAVHFFGLYAIAEAVGQQPAGRAAVLVLTVVCLAGNGAVAVMARGGRADDFDRWLRSTATLGALLSGIAVIWQALPALI